MDCHQEHGEGFAKVNSQGASRKGRKRRKEVKKCLTIDPAEVWSSQTRSIEVISSFVSQSGTTKGIGVSENSFVPNSSDYLSTSSDKHFPRLSASTCLPTGEDKLGQSNEQDCIAASVEVGKCVGLEQNGLSNQETEVKSTSSCSANVISVVDCRAKPPLVPIVEIDNVTCDEDDVNKARGCLSESDSCPGLAVKGIRSQDEVTPIKVKELTEQFPAAIPLAVVLKQFLADRRLDQSYSGGLSSYCLAYLSLLQVLLITRFLQHEHHHGRPINQMKL